ncbi:hypothetical protein GYMLUDRAFT_887210 [Collybiopsis luxurians FD-317 M1]|uniref:Uncharacterized protein n=1 Tax=Collybiopsis luxurians FD-317 M1 TaxID=944289 RepID=A0A0D0BYU0_9AGAR|nr:hypothetical protein GYMLUDRAFT_887210 [Collybiopsis luxurians FD-317 M1]
MDFAQTQRASDIPMEPTFTMDRYSGSGSTNSTIDDSPFGSSLNTPVDEDMLEPFEGIGQRLKELGTLGETKKIESNTAISSMDSERRISASPQPQVPTDQNQSFGSSAAEENFDMSSSFALSDTSAISENLISSFPAVPFSSPEVPTDQFMSKSPSFEAALSRSLRIIQSQSQSAEASPVVVPPTPSILNSTLDESPIFSTPEFEEGFNTHSRASSLYNLPNDPIAISPSMAISDSDSSFYSEVEASITPCSLISKPIICTPKAMPNASTFAAKTQPAISPSTQNDSQAPQDASDLADLAFEYDPEPSYAFSALRSLDFSPTNVPVLIFKLVCFIPWCALSWYRLRQSFSSRLRLSSAKGYPKVCVLGRSCYCARYNLSVLLWGGVVCSRSNGHGYEYGFGDGSDDWRDGLCADGHCLAGL